MNMVSSLLPACAWPGSGMHGRVRVPLHSKGQQPVLTKHFDVGQADSGGSVRFVSQSVSEGGSWGIICTAGALDLSSRHVAKLARAGYMMCSLPGHESKARGPVAGSRRRRGPLDRVALWGCSGESHPSAGWLSQGVRWLAPWGCGKHAPLGTVHACCVGSGVVQESGWSTGRQLPR
jgi:hypothetical protein